MSNVYATGMVAGDPQGRDAGMCSIIAWQASMSPIDVEWTEYWLASADFLSASMGRGTSRRMRCP